MRRPHVGRTAFLAIAVAAWGCLETLGENPYGDGGPDDAHRRDDGGAPTGFTVVPTTGLITTEAGGAASFTVALDFAPTSNVTFALTSSDTSEGTVSHRSLTFTPLNWNAPQRVTVTGVDDETRDGSQAYWIETSPAESGDPHFDGRDPPDVSVMNIDNESPGMTVSPTSGLVTTEAGGSATFTIVLNAPPGADVLINLSSSDPTEGTIDRFRVFFTRENWNAPQTVTVTGVDDDVADGTESYSIVTAPAESMDPEYLGIDADDVLVSNIDDETAGIMVNPRSGLVTTEAGGSATFTIVLNSQPAAEVTVGLTSTNEREGTVSPATVTFTTDDWNAPQTITVTGVDDDVADGNQVYAIVTAPAASGDPEYDGLDTDDVGATNTDDETPGITVSPTGGLVTTEGGGTAAFTIVLQSRPVADVSLGLSSSDTTEGLVDPGGVVFTADDWNAPRTVTVTGVDDDRADGNQPYVVVIAAATSADPNYSGIDPDDVGVSNTDNDSAGITVTPSSGLTTTEGGGSAVFWIVLNSQPGADVGMTLSSSDETEGTIDRTSVAFTPVNWNAPQPVTITGVNDDVADGNQPYTIATSPATSGDPDYDGWNPPDVSVTNNDNDSAGFTVTPTSGVITTEAGGSGTFTIVLNSQPTADVAVGLTSSDTTEGTVGPASVTFTPVNWAAPRTVTVTGVDDRVADGDQPYTIRTAPATSTDARYGDMNPADVSVTNRDNDSAGITVDPSAGLATTEAGGTDTFTIVLNSEPTADVTIGLSSSDVEEGTPSPASVTFTPVNWGAPRTVTVTGVDDRVADGNQPYTIRTAPATSTDGRYRDMNAADVSVTNTDDDSAGITVRPLTGLVTTEAGGTATFTIVLNSEPTADVRIGLTSSDTGEGTVAPATVTFTSRNWNAPQTVTATGVNDDVADGDQPYTIRTGAATSSDANYGGVNPPDVSATNQDNDSPGITVDPTSGLTTTEAGGTATFTIVLSSEPTADVTIGLSSSNVNEGTVAPADVTFTAANWRTPRTVTLTGVDDDVADGNQPYIVVTAQATSTDAGYAAINPPDVSASNTDDDSAGVTVDNPAPGVVTRETGTTDTFTVVLNSEPTADVTIPLESSDTGEATVAPPSLVFTSANWDTPRTVTATGVDDDIADGNQPYTIRLQPATSADTGYAGYDTPDVPATNEDDDSPGIIVVPPPSPHTTEAGGTARFTIVLQSEPTANVVIGLSSDDLSEGTVAPATVTFTPGTWDAPQTVTATGVDDKVDDDDVTYHVVTAAATSSDGNYSGRDADDVTLTNDDDDTAGISVAPGGPIHTTEAGGTATVDVVLASQPTADVVIPISSNDVSEGRVNKSSLTFTDANWDTVQQVTVTGQDDTEVDGDIPYAIVTGAATSADGKYNTMNAADVPAVNEDDDVAVLVVPLSITTHEAAPRTATFRIRLTAEPTDPVTVGVSSSDLSEGTLAVSSVTLNSTNWSAGVEVTVTGVDDFVDDDDVAYTITTAPCVSDDLRYAGMDPPNVNATNVDDDTANIVVAWTGTRLITTEAGPGSGTFTVVLATQPTAGVSIGLSSDTPTEGTVGVSSVSFTTSNWGTAQTVTVTGVDDSENDGDVEYLIVTAPAVSGDPKYSGMDAADVPCTNIDDDPP